MRKYCFFTALFCAFSICTYSQRSADINSPSGANFFWELAGNGGLTSLNYDRRFAKVRNQLGGRIGLGLAEGRPTHMFPEIVVTIPIAINYVMGNGPHFFEPSAGVTIGTSEFGNKMTSAYFVPSLGYRYQPETKRFTFRAFGSSFIGKGNTLYGGISFGRSF